MDNGISKAYSAAREWLALVREASFCLDEPEEWNRYYGQLLETHSRKYKLVPELEKLGKLEMHKSNSMTGENDG